MRISYITENTIDVASDVNDSLLEVDGLIPLEVETLENTPTLQDAILGKYYAENGKVLTLNETENAFLISYPVLIIYNSLLYILKNGQWEVATATKLATARTIGGVSFDGSANIDLPGVNTAGNQNTTGNAATVTNGVYTTGNQTIGGVKTFSSNPISTAPQSTAINALTRKDYVDNKHSGFKNYIINGGFDVWQRGTSQSTPGYGSADRWVIWTGTGTTTAAQSIVVKDSPAYYAGLGRALRVTSTSTDTNKAIFTAQRVENLERLSTKTLTVSFYTRVSRSEIRMYLTRTINYGIGGSEPEGLILGTLPVTTSWTRVSRTFTVPDLLGKTIGASSYLEMVIRLGDGANTAENGDWFEITGVQLEEGSVATPFENRPYGLELSLCQRYFQKSYNENDFAGAITRSSSINWVQTATVSEGRAFKDVQFKTSMRTTPTVTIYSDVTGDAGKISREVGGDLPVAVTNRTGENGLSISNGTEGITGATNQRCSFHYVASAEL